MELTEAWTIARGRLAGMGYEVADTVWFVDDDQVAYRQPDGIFVRRAALSDLDGYPWSELHGDLEPAWIHFNLLQVSDRESVITIRRAPASIPPGHPGTPAVNVSVEPIVATIEES
jgi:hypothetical protein